MHCAALASSTQAGFFSYLWWSYKPYPVEETFEQWVTNRFGKRLYETSSRRTRRRCGVFHALKSVLSWAAQRIQGLSLAKAILSATSDAPRARPRSSR